MKVLIRAMCQKVQKVAVVNKNGGKVALVNRT